MAVHLPATVWAGALDGDDLMDSVTLEGFAGWAGSARAVMLVDPFLAYGPFVGRAQVGGGSGD